MPLNVEAPVILVVGKLDDITIEDNNYLQNVQQIYSVRQIIKRYLTTNLKCVIILDDHFRFTILIQPKEMASSTASNNYEHTLHYIKGMLESIQQSCQDKLEHSISFTVGSKPTTWTEISQQYTALHSLLNYRIGTENTILLVDNEVDQAEESEAKVNSPYDEEFEAEQTLLSLATPNMFTFLEQYLESGQKEKYFEELEQILQPLSAIHDKNNLVAQQAYCSLSMYLLSYMNRWGLRDKVIAKIGEIRLVNTINFYSWGDAAAYIKKLSLSVFELQKLEQKEERIMLYHLFKILSLTILERICHLFDYRSRCI